MKVSCSVVCYMLLWLMRRFPSKVSDFTRSVVARRVGFDGDSCSVNQSNSDESTLGCDVFGCEMPVLGGLV